MSEVSVPQKFAAALDALVRQLERDRSVLAAILCGSLSHDTVWARSDIDHVLDEPSIGLHPKDNVKMIAITGASGSGKSTLVGEILYKALWKHIVDTRTLPGAHDAGEGVEHVHRVVNIDQSPIGRNSRSNPATYIGFYDAIRDLFAATPLSVERDYKPGRFSFNVAGGRCEECQGEGAITTQLYFMPDVEVMCGVCKGARFNSETLEVTIRGKTIADVLDMSVEEGVPFLASEPSIQRKIKVLDHLGLGYLTLGQSSTTLSGERRSASRSPPNWARCSVRSTPSTSSTSRRPGCTWRTSSTCSTRSTVSSMRGTP